MNVITVSPAPKLEPVKEQLRKASPSSVFRFIDKNEIKNILRYGTDRLKSNRKPKWKNEVAIIQRYGLKLSEFTFANTPTGALKLLKDSEDFDPGIYTGGFAFVLYNADKMHRLQYHRTAFTFLDDPLACVQKIIFVEEAPLTVLGYL